MNKSLAKAIECVLEILKEGGARALPLSSVRGLHAEEDKKRGESRTSLADAAIQYVLDQWLVDKVIDFPSYKGEIPLGELTWHLKILSEEESTRLRNLGSEAKTLLKILRECDELGKLGRIREDVALKKLRELGFNVKQVPWIDGKISTFFKVDQGQYIEWYYLVPEPMLSKEYRSAMEKMHKKSVEKEIRLAELDDAEPLLSNGNE